MGEDEAGTRARFNAYINDLVEPAIADRQGRIVKTMGDGLLVEFTSVVNAVECAIAIQNGMKDGGADDPANKRIEFRIGINLGEVLIEGNDIHGDGVNVAARLEGLAQPGGVVISSKVHDEVRGKLDFVFDDLGPQEVKNIAEPVWAFRLAQNKPVSSTAPGSPQSDRPVVAILPFDNMSGEVDQEYFSDGITEDLITALSRIRQIDMVARSSTFSYKGTSPNVRQVSVELGARYVVEGSVRKAGNRVRVTAQLIDGQTGNHIWAERYDREITDIFDVQDEVTETLVGAIVPGISGAERQRAKQISPESLSVWDLYQRGMWHLRKRTIGRMEEDLLEARALFKEATMLDPEFGPAYAAYAETIYYDVMWGSGSGDLEKALQAAKKAIELDGADANAHVALGKIYRLGLNYDAAAAEYKIALGLNSSLADAHYYLAGVLVHTGRAQESILHLEASIRLSPYDDLIGPFYSRLAEAHFSLGDYEKAAELAQTSLGLRGTQWGAYAKLTSALAHLGRFEDAQKALMALRDVLPQATISYVREHFSQTTPHFMDRFLDGLRKAGLPDNAPEQDKPLPLPDKPSIAVLPFENMSGDPEQEYFADGIAEDIITALSRIRQFFVIARNTTFTYKGQSVDVQAVAKDLGVRYVLEGSVRKSGNRVRITAQLIDGESGSHIWGDRYDRELEDIFQVQDEITLTVVGAMEPQLSRVEQERARRKSPEQLDSWDCYQNGLWYFDQITPEGLKESLKLFERAVELNPNMSCAYAAMANAHFYDFIMGSTVSRHDTVRAAMDAAQTAVKLDGDDWAALLSLGLAHHIQRGMASDGLPYLEAAVQLNPSSATGHYRLGCQILFSGKAEDAIQRFETAMRLSPRDVWMAHFMARLSEAYLFMGDYEEAVNWGKRARNQTGPYAWPTRLGLASALGFLDKLDEARIAIDEMRQKQPQVCLRYVEENFPIEHKPYRNVLLDGLKKAGLSEQ
jgi:TolB-like protein/Flp pilus assembly protein TadD